MLVLVGETIDYHDLPGALAGVNIPGARFSNEYPRGALVAGGLAPVLAPGLKGHALATPVAAAGLDNVFVGTAAVGLTIALVGLTVALVGWTAAFGGTIAAGALVFANADDFG